jgi:hypothetical protein
LYLSLERRNGATSGGRLTAKSAQEMLPWLLPLPELRAGLIGQCSQFGSFYFRVLSCERTTSRMQARMKGPSISRGLGSWNQAKLSD